MKHPLRSALTLTLALSIAGAAVADELAWCPAPGTQRKKSLDVQHYLDIARAARAIGEMPAIEGEISGQLSTWERSSWTDRIDAVEGGRVQRFVRHYNLLSAGGAANLAMPGTDRKPRTVKDTSLFQSVLSRHDVRFTWVPREEGYARLWERVDGPEDFLARIDYDTDVASALPGHPVAEGDTWSIPIERAVALLAPGGHRYFEPREPTQFSRTQKVAAGGEIAALVESPQGTITATYRGRREVDGRPHGVVAIELEVASTSDRAEAFESVVPQEEVKEPRALSSCVVVAHFKATGELVWDLEAKQMKSYQLSGIETLDMTLVKETADETDSASKVTEISRLEGTFTLQLVGAEPDPVEPAK